MKEASRGQRASLVMATTLVRLRKQRLAAAASKECQVESASRLHWRKRLPGGDAHSGLSRHALKPSRGGDDRRGLELIHPMPASTMLMNDAGGAEDAQVM